MAAVTSAIGHFFIFLNMSRASLFRKSTSHACNLQQSLTKQRNTCTACAHQKKNFERFVPPARPINYNL